LCFDLGNTIWEALVMLVLGIDPGSTNTGYGLLSDGVGKEPKVVACGVIQAGRGTLTKRLGKIHSGFQNLFTAHKPDMVAIEEVFYARNVKSSMTLAHARGAALAAVGQAGLGVCEYSARTVKKTITGFGGADKQQVRQMLKAVLGSLPEELDATDALAVALCHLRLGKDIARFAR
jgi:crossover junction endodeoxyribonuclease RuvC